MSAYEGVCFWVGAFTLGLSTLVTLVLFADWVLDRVIRSLKLYRAVLQFFWDRRAKTGTDEPNVSEHGAGIQSTHPAAEKSVVDAPAVTSSVPLCSCDSTGDSCSGALKRFRNAYLGEHFVCGAHERSFRYWYVTVGR